MRTVKLKEFVNSNNYSEMSQAINCKFSFVRKDTSNSFTELFSPVKCKDYLEDILIASKKGLILRGQIYGFNYPKIFDISDNIYLCIKATPDHINNIKRFTTIMHSFESGDKSEVILVKDSSNRLILHLNSMWTYSTLMLSMLTYLLRICKYYNNLCYNLRGVLKQFPNISVNDSMHAKNWLKYGDMDFLAFNYKEILLQPLTGYSDDVVTQEIFDNCDNNLCISIYNLHDELGTVSFINDIKDNNKRQLGSTWVESYNKLIKVKG